MLAWLRYTAFVTAVILCWSSLYGVLTQLAPETGWWTRPLLFGLIFLSVCLSASFVIYYGSFCWFSLKRYQGKFRLALLLAAPLGAFVTLAALLQYGRLLTWPSFTLLVVALVGTEYLLFPRAARRPGPVVQRR